MSVETLVTEYLEFLVSRRNLRPLTVKTYRRTLDEFAEWLVFNGFTLEELGPDDVEDFGWRPLKRDGDPPSAATARRQMTSVIQFLKWAVARRGVATNAHLAVVMPSTPDRVPKPVSDDLWRALWLSELSLDDRVWLGLAYFCGLRRFEIVRMRPHDVQMLDGMLRFERKRGKVRQVEYRAIAELVARELPWVTEGWSAWADSLEALALTRRDDQFLSIYVEADDPFLDGNRLTKRLYRICDTVGVERIGPHRLRHSCATNLFRAGLPPEVVQDIMGHESFNTTKGYMSVSGYLQRRLEAKGTVT